jgi:hypothetical protein
MFNLEYLGEGQEFSATGNVHGVIPVLEWSLQAPKRMEQRR